MSSANATSSSSAASNATSSSSSSDANATSTSASNATSTAAAAGSDEEIAVIEGQDFAPGEVVLVFSGNNIVAIDDVDDGGDIEAKVPVTDLGTDMKFVETGTTRTADFNFDGQTLIAAAGQGEIQAEGTNQDKLNIDEILRSGTNGAEIEGQDDNNNTDDREDSN
jgi:hypothetical protein